MGALFLPSIIVLMAVVYLIHLDKPIHNARHYLGYTSLPVQARLARHKSGHGARLLKQANRLGIDYTVVRTWGCADQRQARRLERKLKRGRNSPKLCPKCNKRLQQEK